MKIGGVEAGRPVFLAPMAGVTDMAFRVICRQQGCGLVCTEMVSAKALCYGDAKTRMLTLLNEKELPASIQIFGSEPDIIAEAAAVLNDTKASFIDINMGCPTPRITRNGEGAALMRQPRLAGEIVQAVVKVSNKPVTVKMRKGWDENSVNAVYIAHIAEDSGAAAVTVHGRTRQQFYRESADLDIIARVKDALSIPVTGNGDIFEPEDAFRMIHKTGCDAVMIGRGAQGNPWIFSSISAYLDNGRKVEGPSTAERIEMIEKHLDSVIQSKGERTGVLQMRKHIAWYLKGLRDSAHVKNRIFTLVSRDDIMNVLYEYEKKLEDVTADGP